MTFSGYDHQGSRHAICQVVLPWAVDALDVLRCAQRKWLWLRLACAGATRAAAAVFFEWKHHGDGNQERNLECQRWHTDWSSALLLWSKFLFFMVFGRWSIALLVESHFSTILEPQGAEGVRARLPGWRGRQKSGLGSYYSMIFHDLLWYTHNVPWFSYSILHLIHRPKLTWQQWVI